MDEEMPGAEQRGHAATMTERKENINPPSPDRVNALARLLAPRSIALYGGDWAENVIRQLRRAGFPGPIWPVHPARDAIAGVPCHRALRTGGGMGGYAYGLDRKRALLARERG